MVNEYTNIAFSRQIIALRRDYQVLVDQSNQERQKLKSRHQSGYEIGLRFGRVFTDASARILKHNLDKQFGNSLQAVAIPVDEQPVEDEKLHSAYVVPFFQLGLPSLDGVWTSLSDDDKREFREMMRKIQANCSTRMFLDIFPLVTSRVIHDFVKEHHEWGNGIRPDMAAQLTFSPNFNGANGKSEEVFDIVKSQLAIVSALPERSSGLFGRIIPFGPRTSR